MKKNLNTLIKKNFFRFIKYQIQKFLNKKRNFLFLIMIKIF
jgi:hypothetical protein